MSSAVAVSIHMCKSGEKVVRRLVLGPYSLLSSLSHTGPSMMPFA
jgi:hypothetical protein